MLCWSSVTPSNQHYNLQLLIGSGKNWTYRSGCVDWSGSPAGLSSQALRLLTRSSWPWLPVANAWIVEDMGECVCLWHRHSGECAAGLQQQDCGLDWKGRERKLGGFHAAGQNGSPSTSSSVYVWTLVLAKFQGWHVEGQMASIHPSICSALNSAKLGTFPGHVHGSQRTLFPVSTQSFCLHQRKNSELE